jgi:putative sigma-54 modulation protein
VKEVDVKLSATGGHGRGGEAHAARAQTAEVTVYTLRHGVVRVEDTEADLYAAVDLVADKLRRKLQRVKEKAAARGTWPGRGGPRGGPGLPGALADAGEGDGAAEGVGALPSDGGAAAAAPREGIVREKVLFLEASMSADEAVDRLEAVGHDFFVFSDVADGAVKVVYRRKSAGYGLLIPQA